MRLQTKIINTCLSILCLILVSCYGDPSSTTGPSDNNNTGDNGNGGNDTSPLVVTHFNTIDEQTKVFSTMFGGYQRTFIVHVPPNFDPNYSVPLLFVLHGYTSNANLIHSYSGFDDIADQENFIAVYVQGTTDIYQNTGWNVDVVASFAGVDDVGFFKALIEYFKTDYNINSEKIFSCGMSLGGFMSYRLACELDEINGIGSVTGSMAALSACNPPNKKNIIHFHGTSDTVVPYNGVVWSLPVQDAHDFWANKNNCKNQSQIIVPDFNNDGIQSTQFLSNDCDDGNEVILYEMKNEGHTWFRKGWGHDLNSSELIWEFFKDK